jgi:hypothetical protein
VQLQVTYQPIGKEEVERIREGADTEDAEDDQVHGNEPAWLPLINRRTCDALLTQAESTIQQQAVTAQWCRLLQFRGIWVMQVHDYLKGGILIVYVKQASPLCPPCHFQVPLPCSVHVQLTAILVLQAVHLVRKARILNPIFSAKSQVKVRQCHTSAIASHVSACIYEP